MFKISLLIDKVEKGPLKLSELGTGHGNALSNTHNEELVSKIV